MLEFYSGTVKENYFYLFFYFLVGGGPQKVFFFFFLIFAEEIQKQPKLDRLTSLVIYSAKIEIPSL